MANSPVVSSLSEYVNEQREPLILKALVGAKTAGLINIETGVKAKTALNLLTTSIEFGNGGACGWNEAGTSTLSQRFIDPVFLKVNMGFCDKALLKKWASYKVTMEAKGKTLPFEEYFVQDIINNINVEVEKKLWQDAKDGGSTSTTVGKGFIRILQDDAAAIDVTFAAGTAINARIMAMYNAIPAAIVNKEGTCIFVSEADYRAYIQYLVGANLYHFAPDYKNGEYFIPGTGVKVIATSGLNSSAKSGDEHAIGTFDRMVAGNVDNMFYGCASEGDKESFDLWYSQDNREFRLAIEFAEGVQVAFPDQMVLGQGAAA